MSEPQSVDTLLKNACVVAVDQSRRVFTDGYVAFQGGLLLAHCSKVIYPRFAIALALQKLPQYPARRALIDWLIHKPASLRQTMASMLPFVQQSRV